MLNSIVHGGSDDFERPYHTVKSISRNKPPMVISRPNYPSTGTFSGVLVLWGIDTE